MCTNRKLLFGIQSEWMAALMWMRFSTIFFLSHDPFTLARFYWSVATLANCCNNGIKELVQIHKIQVIRSITFKRCYKITACCTPCHISHRVASGCRRIEMRNKLQSRSNSHTARRGTGTEPENNQIATTRTIRTHDNTSFVRWSSVVHCIGWRAHSKHLYYKYEKKKKRNLIFHVHSYACSLPASRSRKIRVICPMTFQLFTHAVRSAMRTTHTHTNIKLKAKELRSTVCENKNCLPFRFHHCPQSARTVVNDAPDWELPITKRK